MGEITKANKLRRLREITGFPVVRAGVGNGDPHVIEMVMEWQTPKFNQDRSYRLDLKGRFYLRVTHYDPATGFNGQPILMSRWEYIELGNLRHKMGRPWWRHPKELTETGGFALEE